MNKKTLLLLWLIFLITHLINLLKLPLFEDEALYLFLSDKMSQSPLQFIFIYPQNGLLPMFGWFVSLINIFFHDSLIAGRFLNILLSSTLIFWIAGIGKLFQMKKPFQIMAILLLIISPIIHLNSRVALLDISILVFTSWYIYFTVKYLKEKKCINLIFLFISLLTAFLTKATAVFGILPVILLVSLNYKSDRKFKTLYLWLGGVYFAVFTILGLILFFFGPQIGEDSGSSLIIHQTYQEIFAKIKTNIFLTYHWAKTYYLPFFFLPLIFFFFHKKIRKHEFYLLMAVWIFSSVTFMIFLNRFYYPRHILILSLPLIIITASLLSEIPKKISLILFLFICFTRIQLGWDIVTNVFQSNLALEDRFEYFENYTSGVNVAKTANMLRELSKGEEIVVWLDGSYILEYGLRHEMRNDKVIFKSFRLGENSLPHALSPVTKNIQPAYVLTNRWEPKNLNRLKLIKSFDVSFRHTQRLYIIP